MSILVNKDTRLVVQGITGREGMFHTEQMVAYGTNVVGGVTPGKGGQWSAGVPVFDTVREAVLATEANTSIIYVPARFAPDAILEAADAGIKLIVCITEGVPTLDMIQVRAYLDHGNARLIGPNCPGLITPGEAKVGIMPGHIHIRVTLAWSAVVARLRTRSLPHLRHAASASPLLSESAEIRSSAPLSSTFFNCLRKMRPPSRWL